MYVEMYEAYMLLEFLGGWGGGLRINPFCGGGMDNLWNYTMNFWTLFPLQRQNLS